MASGINSIITEQDRLEAAAVSTSHAGHKFEIQLGHLCNNRCVFCSSGQLTALKLARPIPLEPIVEALEEARENGATHLTFLGGEPTIHKRFLDALAKAVELGFEHIVIFTNGVMFPHPGFIDSVCALGSFEWRISIQGATDEAHVAATGRADAFQRIVHGLGELQRRGQLVTTNMCVNEHSYRSLPHYPELLERYGVSQLHVDIVRPASTGERDEEYLRDIMPRYSDMAPYYAEMLEGFERWDPDFDVNVGNLPYCIMPAWGHRIHHGGEETVTKSSDRDGLEDSMNKYEWHESLRTYVPGCDDCVFRSRCTGIFRVYLEMYGAEEFRPIGRAELAEIDSARRNFVILSEPLLAPLRAALAAGDLPERWTLVTERSEDRRSTVELILTHEGGGTVTLRFVRPGRGRSPVATTPHYDLDAEAGLDVDAQTLAPLLAWVGKQLAAAPSTPNLRFHDDAVERTLRAALLARGRRRVTALAARLQRDFAVEGWRVVPQLQWHDPDTATLSVEGPRAHHVELRFAIGSASARSQVDVDFHAGKGTGPGVAESIFAELTALLRSQGSKQPSTGDAHR